jgi:hypothetical protein
MNAVGNYHLKMNILLTFLLLLCARIIIQKICFSSFHGKWECFMRNEVLSTDTMRPGFLEPDLKTTHKPKEFLADKLQCLKRMKLDTIGGFHQETARLVKAS